MSQSEYVNSYAPCKQTLRDRLVASYNYMVVLLYGPKFMLHLYVNSEMWADLLSNHQFAVYY